VCFLCLVLGNAPVSDPLETTIEICAKFKANQLHC